jgi:hypothetical protein
VHGCSLHLNQRWILNYAPHVIVLGVGQSITNSELYNAANHAVMLLGNDHTLNNSYIHDVVQQCQDCGAFYTGRALTYRGNVVADNTWRRCQSIWGDNTQAIYLDDGASSVWMQGNLFDGIDTVLVVGAVGARQRLCGQLRQQLQRGAGRRLA